MNKLYLFYVMLSASTMSCAMNENQLAPQKPSILSTPITLPSAEIIKKRLEYLGLDHFNETMEFHETFGDQHMCPSDVVYSVYAATHRYNKQNSFSEPSSISKQDKSFIIRALVGDHPRIIGRLIKRKIIINPQVYQQGS